MIKIFKQKYVLAVILFFLLIMSAFFCFKNGEPLNANAAGETENAVIYRNGEAVAGYTTFALANTNSQAGDLIKLNANLAISNQTVSKNNIKIDLNGYNLSGSSVPLITVNSTGVEIYSSAGISEINCTATGGTSTTTAVKVSGSAAFLTLGENLKVVSKAGAAVAVDAAALTVDGAYINAASSSIIVYNGGQLILEDNLNTTVHGIYTGTNTNNHGYIDIRNGLMFKNFTIADLNSNLNWAKKYLTITGGYFQGLARNSDGTTRYDSDIYDIKPADIANTYYTESITLQRVYPYANAHWNIEGDVQTEKYEIHVDTPEYSGLVPSKAKTVEFSFEFAGWSLTEGENAQVIEDFSVLHEHTTFYAVFESSVNKYIFSYRFNGETITMEYFYGDTIVPPDAPEKNGYTFNSWQLDGESFDFKWDNITEDIELAAKYNVNSYTVTFVPNNGTENSSSTQDYDTAIEAPVLEKAGHTFMYWLYNGSEYTVDKMPAENITLYALWRVDYVQTVLNEQEKTNTSLNYQAQEDYEFALEDLDGALIYGWSESAIFDNLIAGATYKLLIRVKGDGEYNLPSLPTEELVTVYSNSEYFVIILTDYYQNKLDSNEYLTDELTELDGILAGAVQEITDAQGLGDMELIYDRVIA